MIPIPPLEFLLRQSDIKSACRCGRHFSLVDEAFCLAGYALPLEWAAILVLAVAVQLGVLVVVLENINVVLFD